MNFSLLLHAFPKSMSLKHPRSLNKSYLLDGLIFNPQRRFAIFLGSQEAEIRNVWQVAPSFPHQ